MFDVPCIFRESFISTLISMISTSSMSSLSFSLLSPDDAHATCVLEAMDYLRSNNGVNNSAIKSDLAMLDSRVLSWFAGDNGTEYDPSAWGQCKRATYDKKMVKELLKTRLVVFVVLVRASSSPSPPVPSHFLYGYFKLHYSVLFYLENLYTDFFLETRSHDESAHTFFNYPKQDSSCPAKTHKKIPKNMDILI